MINILVLEEPKVSNVAYWRLFRPLQVMRQLYPGVFNYTFKRKNLDYVDIAFCDVLIVVRPMNLEQNEVIMRAKQNGARIIIDLDDDLLQLPEDHELYSMLAENPRGNPKRQNLIQCLEAADLFWFSTPKFLETYSKNAVVVPNAVLPGDLPDAPAPDRKLWAWRGRAVQTHDLLGAGLEWYEKIKHAPDKWLFLGYKPPLKHGNNTETLPYIENPADYFQAIMRLGLNVLWKPMTPNRFNEHKSNISVLEATMSGGYCLTNFSGKPGWEYASAQPLEYKAACELWAAAKDDIILNYNLLDTARMRAQSIFQLCSHLLNTSQSTANT